MRGRILACAGGVDGLISGEDGQRYAFAAPDLPLGQRGARVGAEVDFEMDGARAARVYVLREAAAERNRVLAALLAFVFGSLGVHKFYLGRTRAGVIMLLCGTIGWLLILPGLFAVTVALIECVIYLVRSDLEFQREYVEADRAWF